MLYRNFNTHHIHDIKLILGCEYTINKERSLQELFHPLDINNGYTITAHKKPVCINKF